MSAVSEPLVQAGDVITAPEGLYTLGQGTLRMRVTKVLHRPDEDLRDRYWIQVSGVEIGPVGRDRTVWVRSRALVDNPPERRPRWSEAYEPR